MEAVAEMPISQEVQLHQHETWQNGPVGPSNTICPEDPSRAPSGNSEGNILPQDKGHASVCRNFNRGHCFRGRLCKYQHSLLGEQERSAFKMCRDFIRGSCTYGEYCKFGHSEFGKHGENRSHGNVNLGNFANLGKPHFSEVNGDDNLKSSLPREHRSTTPCWNFPSGRCFRGSDCPYSHVENTAYVRPRDDETSHHSIHRESRSRSPCRKFLGGSCFRGSSCPYLHPDMSEPKFDRNTQPHQGNGTITHGEFGNDKKVNEFCLKFAQGRCDRGDSCRYFHSFHEYAKSQSQANKEPCSVSEDGALDEQSKRQYADDSFDSNVVDQKREPQVVDEKGETDGEISLWSQPFKRRRSWSESPFTHRGDFSCRSTRRDGFQNSFTRDRNYNLVPFQYHRHGPDHRTCSRFDLDNQPQPNVTTSSMGLPFGQVNNYSNTKIPNHNDDISKGRIGGSPKEVKFDVNDGEVRINSVKLKGKLLILDVNGILGDIVADYPEDFKPDTVVSMKGVFKRPFCDEFLDFCFERFDVGVWSSRNQKNVDKVTDFLFGDSKKKLLFCWDQSYCTDTEYKTFENRDKPLLLKELRRLWEKQIDDLPWDEGYYNVTNTVLLDDSPCKALRNPPYTAVFPFPFTFRDSKDTDLGPNGKLRLYLEALSKADNVQKFIRENPFGQKPITKSSFSWHFYSKIV